MTAGRHKADKPRSLVERAKSLGPKFSDLDQRTLAAFLDQFGLMLQCGLQPSTALEALVANQPSQKLCAVIDDVSNQIHTGHTLADAMGRHSDVFPGTVLILVKVGEQSGDLAGQLRRAGEMVQRTDTFVSKVKGAITGPLVTAGFCGLILFLIVKLVFPRFVAMYDSMDIEFPAVSKVVLSIVSVVNHPITLGLVVLLAVFVVTNRKKVQNLALDFLLAFPPTRPVLGSMLCATTCETLSTLHAQGVPLHRALTLIADSVPYRTHKANLQDCKRALVNTGSLHESLAGIDYFPSFFHAMVAIGEETGALDDLLQSCQKMLEEEIENLVDRVASALEPAVTCLMGVAMGVLFVGMFLPIYGVLNQLGGF
jgi:type IV pilus assembly protein PilC